MLVYSDVTNRISIMTEEQLKTFLKTTFDFDCEHDNIDDLKECAEYAGCAVQDDENSLFETSCFMSRVAVRLPQRGYEKAKIPLSLFSAITHRNIVEVMPESRERLEEIIKHPSGEIERCLYYLGCVALPDYPAVTLCLSLADMGVIYKIKQVADYEQQ